VELAKRLGDGIVVLGTHGGIALTLGAEGGLAAEDIAGLAIFLASKAGQYTVGETITCDGGLVASAGHDLTNE
jgi:NAD(P)-dependent dehydrogenase (short-subunit alcohol dehydrogenase family)